VWHELILLRELRADRWAAQFVDPLLLAETLLTVARSADTSASPSNSSNPDTPIIAGIGFHDFATIDSFEARINALMASDIVPEPAASTSPKPHTQDDRLTFSIDGWLWVVLACFPLLAVPFHHI
jgi:hypothetical protein